MNLASEIMMEMYRRKLILDRITGKELDYWLSKIVGTLVQPWDNMGVMSPAITGEHRKQQWEDGWNENFEDQNAVPKYFGKYPVVRWEQELMKADDSLEYEMFCILQEIVFKEYLVDVDTVYEFGCGTGHNLSMAKFNLLANKRLIGLDWVDSAISCTQSLGFEAYKFDMFYPNYDFRLRENSAVITVASMEQLGENYNQFTQYLIAQRPKLVIHIEPIGELLDPTNFMDYLSLLYFKKRRYLKGYLTYLESLQEVNVIRKERSYVGSLFIDGYSLIVWHVK